MAQYAVIDNRTNAVLEVVEWDGTDPGSKPDRATDTTLLLVPAGMTPTEGQTWNGSVFIDPPAEPVPPEEDAPTRGGRRKKSQEDEDA